MPIPVITIQKSIVELLDIRIQTKKIARLNQISEDKAYFYWEKYFKLRVRVSSTIYINVDNQ